MDTHKHADVYIAAHRGIAGLEFLHKVVALSSKLGGRAGEPMEVILLHNAG